ncbi:MAG: peroxiredoxin family protein [Planctomycetes bacterium]|nr:peroxiredoxin family protein [Planctomycetota bacterium]
MFTVVQTVSGHRISLPVVTAGLLFLTAGLKLLFAVRTTTWHVAYDLPSWLVLAAVEAELLVAFLLFTGLWPLFSWRAALILFIIFGLYSLYRISAGYESCGCFGPLRTSPVWSLALNIGIISLLVARRQAFTERRRTSAGIAKLCASTASYVVVGGLSVFVMIGSAQSLMIDDGSLIGNGKLVVLKPTEWINQKFPLDNVILPQTNVGNGKWVVLLYHHNCPKCQQVLPRYEQYADEIAKRGVNTNVMLLEIPPFGELLHGVGPALYARLSTDTEWFVQSPVEIQLSDGNVTFASLDLPSISDIP